MEFGKSDWRAFEQGIQKEWLLTNGIGGFASSTVIGVNTRRYHGLLVASLKPPVSRHLILSKIDETIIIGEEKHDLYSYQTPAFIKKGYYNLQRVVVDPLPSFIYNVKDIFIEKKIAMVHGENTTVIVYHIINGGRDAVLRLTPLVNYRDYHQNSNKLHMSFTSSAYSNGVKIKPYNLDLDINIYCSEGQYAEYDNCFFYNMYYAVEQERGLQDTEDHFIPGCFEVALKPGEEKYITVIASIEKELKCLDGRTLIDDEERRIKQLIDKAGYQDDFARDLVMAADKFIVYRKSTDAKTIIAGYPWFTDWGRDTMIALPGLTLATGRFRDARDILYTFSKYVKQGLIPNMFPEEGQESTYNSVDAPLLYFEAVMKYIKYTDDYQFIKENIYGVLIEIIEAYVRGTLFNIKMDEDYLINAGEEGHQLTWMDAKIGDWVVTPRHGKAVEINALWYNALKIASLLASRFGYDSSYYDGLAEGVKASFNEKFWNADRDCLYDVISDKSLDNKVRPNQILAVSLSNPLLDGEKAIKVVQKVWKELYTAYGLKSLSGESKKFVGVYIGDQYHRDSAYHQGTVWTWPLGHFITAFMKTYGYAEENRKKALLFIEPFKDHMRDACVGNISEIFDGDEPITPRGCFAQAWSVAEILRAYSEDVLVK